MNSRAGDSKRSVDWLEVPPTALSLSHTATGARHRATRSGRSSPSSRQNRAGKEEEEPITTGNCLRAGGAVPCAEGGGGLSSDKYQKLSRAWGVGARLVAIIPRVFFFFLFLLPIRCVSPTACLSLCPGSTFFSAEKTSF